MPLCDAAAMKVVFRCDAAPAIGGGHVMRCLTLAGELTRRGAAVCFAVNEEAARYVPSLQRAGYPTDAIAYFAEVSSFGEQQVDFDVVICDSYDIDEAFERPLRQWAKKIVVIDDLANRRHDCDLLVDATFGRSAADYRNLIPPNAEVLAGARYALLRPEFGALREESLARRANGGGVERILVSLGLTDLGGITARVVAALLDQSLRAKINVVIGPNAPSRNALEAMGARDHRVVLHIDPPNMARLMVDADLAIGAGGTTTWERCCLGLPTVLLILADNQRLVAQKLEEAGALLATRGTPEPDLFDLVEKVRALVEVEGMALRREMSAAAAAITDGCGSKRVARNLCEGIKRQDERSCSSTSLGCNDSAGQAITRGPH